MVFCNLDLIELINYDIISHNPYFNRWFSAIVQNKGIYDKE